MSDIDQTLKAQDGQPPAAQEETPVPGGAPRGDDERPAQGGGASHLARESGPDSGVHAHVQAGGAEGKGERDGAADLAGDLDELVTVAAQRDEYLALAQRTQADFENYRKRVAREAAAAQERGVTALAKELLPALDNLDRALGAAAEDDPLLEGVRLVRAELSAALTRLGIESFSPQGEVFDPSLHEALAAVPAAGEDADGPPSGIVLEVYQAGYRLGESVIRPARVVVSA